VPHTGGGGGQKYKPRVFDSRILRKIFGLKRNEVQGRGKDYINRNIMISTPLPSLFK
jgi:hypothetical protein